MNKFKIFYSVLIIGGYGSPRPYSWQLDELKNKDYFRKLRPVK